jgi:hypothetical protein
MNDLDIEQTSFYFWSQYKTHIEHNPDFINELKKSIDFIDNKREEIIKAHRKDWRESEVSILNGMVPFSYLFQHIEEEEFISEFTEEVIISSENLDKLKEGVSLFEIYVIKKEVPKNNIPTTPTISLVQKIHLLKKLGFFELKQVNDLNDMQKGNLVSLLLQSSKKNTYDKIRERFYEKDIKTQIDKLNNILTELGLEKL